MDLLVSPRFRVGEASGCVWSDVTIILLDVELLALGVQDSKIYTRLATLHFVKFLFKQV